MLIYIIYLNGRQCCWKKGEKKTSNDPTITRAEWELCDRIRLDSIFLENQSWCLERFVFCEKILTKDYFIAEKGGGGCDWIFQFNFKISLLNSFSNNLFILQIFSLITKNCKHFLIAFFQWTLIKKIFQWMNAIGTFRIIPMKSFAIKGHLSKKNQSAYNVLTAFSSLLRRCYSNPSINYEIFSRQSFSNFSMDEASLGASIKRRKLYVIRLVFILFFSKLVFVYGMD